MKRVIITLLALLPLFATAKVEFEQSTFEKALKRANKENKGVLVDVVSGRVDENSIEKIFANKELEALITESFVTIRRDLLVDEEYDDFAEHLGNLSYPVAIFFNAKGERLAFCHWDLVTIGQQDLAEIVGEALVQAEVKRSNTREIEFSDLDFKEALELAAESNKPLFVECHFDGCGPCRKMEEDVFTLDRVADFYNDNFISIKIDRARDPHGVIEKYGVRGFPAFIFISPSGELLLKEDGGRGGDEFIELGRRALNAPAQGEGAETLPMTKIGSAAAKSGSGTAMSGSLSASASTSAPSTSGSMASTSAATVTTSSVGLAEDGVAFLKLSLNDAMAMAKREGKAIYADMSATWCNPCKMMKKTTFSDEDVIEFMNENFINIYFECDTDGEMSEEYRIKYATSAFPTHLIIDENGELLHKFVGYKEPMPFLEELRKGVVSEKGLHYYNKRYEQGERSPEFMHEYIVMLANAQEGVRASGLANEYLETLPIEQLATRENFMLIHEFVRDLDSPLAQKIFANGALFDEGISKHDMDGYTRMLWIIKAISFVEGEEGSATFDKEGYESFLLRLGTSGLGSEQESYIETMSTLANQLRMGEWKAYVKSVTDYMKEKKGDANPMYTCNWGLDFETRCTDKGLRQKLAKAIGSNFELIKKKNREDGMIWAESIEVLIEQLNK